MASYNKVTPELVEALKKVAPSRVFVGGDINEDYAHDEMPIYGSTAPEVVVEAQTTEEISEIVKLCNKYVVPLVPRGAGTGLVGGAVPIHGGVLLSITKMNKILEYDLENFVVRVEAGILLNDLAEDVSKKGLLYPPDPGEKFATLGGNVSTNAGGMRAVKYGTTRDYVEAMKVVLPTGEITEFGAKVSKTSTGYSLLDLMIGSEGTLGIITELTLKLIAQPKQVISLIIPYVSLDECIATVPKFFQNHFNPQALEFMEREIVISSEAYIGKSIFPQQFNGQEIGAYLLVTFDGESEDELMDVIEKASEMVLESGALDVIVADTPTKIRESWAARGSFLEAIEADTKLLDECDVVVPVSEIASYLQFVNGLEGQYGFKIKSFGHAGDGNLHIYTCSNDMPIDEFKKKVDDFMKVIYKKAYEVGGLLSGEHGIGHGKIDYFADAVGPVNLQLMLGIKKVFDPNLILNPGKVCYKV
jgi:glycolate oxidase